MAPSAKRAKTSSDPIASKGKTLFASGSKSRSSLEVDDPIAASHELIDLAKSGKWQEVFIRLDVKKELVNVRPDVREYSALHQAAFHGNSEVVMALISKYGADPSLQTKHGQSVLEVAKEQGHLQLVELLSSSCPGVSTSSCSSSTAVAAPVAKTVKPVPSLTAELVTSAHQLIDQAKAGRWQDVFKMLDSHHELVNIRPDVREYSALHQAAYHDNKEVLATLITKYGADPTLLTASGMTLLEVAEMQGSTTVIESLSSLPIASAEEEAESDHDDGDLEVKKMPDGSWKVVQKSAPHSDAPCLEVEPGVKVEPMLTTSQAIGSLQTVKSDAPLLATARAMGSSKPASENVPNNQTQDLVDKYFPKQSSCRVYCDADATWHCMLKRGNQFHILQLLEISPESYCVWSRWGKTGTKGQDESEYFVSPELATAAFRSKFFEKTSNKWDNRHNFKQFFCKFTYSPEPELQKEKSTPVLMPAPELTTDAIQQAHKIIDLAKAGRWSDLFNMLEMNKGLVNVRPEVREYSVLHQAVFQGACDVSLKLVDEYGADPAQCTKFGKSVASIAEEQGYAQLAEKMRERIAKHMSAAGG